MLINKGGGISFLLSNGQSGEITDPAALRAFYVRIFYAKNKKRSRKTKTCSDPNQETESRPIR